jgi:hypothetical protein
MHTYYANVRNVREKELAENTPEHIFIHSNPTLKQQTLQKYFWNKIPNCLESMEALSQL